MRDRLRQAGHAWPRCEAGGRAAQLVALVRPLGHRAPGAGAIRTRCSSSTTTPEQRGGLVDHPQPALAPARPVVSEAEFLSRVMYAGRDDRPADASRAEPLPPAAAWSLPGRLRRGSPTSWPSAAAGSLLRELKMRTGILSPEQRRYARMIGDRTHRRDARCSTSGATRPTGSAAGSRSSSPPSPFNLGLPSCSARPGRQGNKRNRGCVKLHAQIVRTRSLFPGANKKEPVYWSNKTASMWRASSSIASGVSGSPSIRR